MGDPVTIALVATAVSSAGQLYSGYQQSKAASYNAKVQEQAAVAAEQKAEYDETAHRQRVQSILSSQRALYGKSGVELTGSPLLVLEDTAKQGEMDALAIRYGGDVEAAQQRSGAALSKMQSSSALTSGVLGAGSSLLSGYSKYKG